MCESEEENGTCYADTYLSHEMREAHGGWSDVHPSKSNGCGFGLVSIWKIPSCYVPASVHVYQRVRIFLDFWGFLEISFLRWFLGNVKGIFEKFS